MSTSPLCFHCGAPIETEPRFRLEIDGKSAVACSEGCRKVAQLIDDRGLGEFYKFREGPADFVPDETGHPDRWSGYDRAAVQREFVSFDEEGTRRAHLLLEGVKCAACVWLIEAAMRAVPGVQGIVVDPLTGRAELHWNPDQIQLSKLLSQLSRLGYRPSPYTEDETDRAVVRERRMALKRLIVAGLGMMQVGSYAIGMYAGAFQAMDTEIAQFLRLISLLVATPIVFYSGAPFFLGAWRDLKMRRPGMDVPVALAVGSAYGASVWNTLTGSGDVYFDSATMFVFFLSGARFLEMAGRHRALNLTGALARHLPQVATRMVDGRVETVGVLELQKNDLVLVDPGSVIPADGVLSADEARVDEAVLTGESLPVRKRRNETVVAGSINLVNAISVRVRRVGAATVLAQISHMVTGARDNKPRVMELADRVASWFVTGMLFVAGCVGIFWWQTAPDRAFEIVLAVLVVTCPCALALATPASFTVATSVLARRGFMLRRAGALQVLSRVTDMLLDKTGTLTNSGTELLDVVAFGAHSKEEVLAIAAALESRSEHPVAKAFPESANQDTVKEVRAVPGEGLEGVVDGRLYRIGRPEFAESLASTLDQNPAHEPRTQDCEIRSVYLGDKNGILARFEIAEQVRPGAVELVKAASAAGVRTAIVSGDRLLPVKALAGRLGIAKQFANLRPGEKIGLVRQLQAEGKIVVMVGDGINDSPVLAGADVSVAMGSGTSLAQHSADCVLMSTSLEPIAEALAMARRTMQVIQQNMIWAIGYNLIAIPLAASGLLAPWMAALGMSASSLLVTMNALRLGWQRGAKRVTPEKNSGCGTPAEQPQ